MATPKQNRDRGFRYEREVAHFLNTELFPNTTPIHRVVGSGGGRMIGFTPGAGQADLVGAPMLHLELKRTQALRPYEAMEQAEASIHASGSHDIPVVVTRKDGVSTEDSLVLLRLKDFLTFYSALLQGRGYL